MNKYINWTVISRRTENISFSRMRGPAPCNTSDNVGTYPYEIITLEHGAFVRNGFVSPEFRDRTEDVIVIEGRYFTVGRSETGSGKDKKTWRSASLPPELDPTPPAREWDVVVENDGELYSVDKCFTSAKPFKIRVREVKP